MNPPNPASSPHASDAVATFFEAVEAAIATRSLASLVLSKPRQRRGAAQLVRVRHIDLKGEPALSFTTSTHAGDTTQNRSIGDGLQACRASLDPGGTPSFAHATLHAANAVVQLLINRRGQATLRRQAVANEAEASPPSLALPAHDRPRSRLLPLELPCWVELGITDAEHRLVPSMARKWRQIDKFLAVIDKAIDAIEPSGGKPLRVVDFGCGKGYLTFAVHEHLRRRFGRAPEVVGVELRSELVEFSNAAASRCGANGLRFVQGDLRSFAPGEVDVMIALHACDTATDHAIDLGLRAGAGVLVCSPCCHKELRPQMTKPRPLAGVLRHGVHLGQEAEMVTDSLRALLLEACGYDASVFEFVALEHTSKNKMILATRRPDAAAQVRALAQVRDVKDFYGVREQCLETLLQRRGRLPVVAPPPAQACQTP